jgi:hypothetical protein
MVKVASPRPENCGFHILNLAMELWNQSGFLINNLRTLPSGIYGSSLVVQLLRNLLIPPLLEKQFEIP